MSKVVGEKIRSIRLEYGDNKREFGERFNPKASGSNVSKWEKGKNIPNNKRLKEIAELGNITVDELLRTNVKSAGAKKALGERIKSIRFSRNETLEGFSNEINRVSNGVVKCGKSNVSRWERGENEPNYYTLLAISKIGNTTVDKLLGNTCQLCNGQMLTADFYEEKSDLFSRYVVTEDRKIITHVYAGEEYLGFSEIDISYCPECGRKLEVKQ